MTVPPDATTPTATEGRAAVAPPLSAAARERVKQLALEFESLLMSQMLREMRNSMVEDSDDQDQGFGAANMMDTADTALGAALSKAGGFGLAEVLLRGLDRQFGPAAPQTVFEAPAGVQGVSPPVTPGVSAPGAQDVSPAQRVSAVSGEPVTAPSGRVSSAYGWRADPLNGHSRFHKGTDIALAYGHEVQAAASGRVAFAGERPGYGMTVVIDHGGGLETRYAHLSGYAVKAGDAVGSGQVVARSGNSGRSTGPHLHFEVLQGGKAVDPASLAAVRS